MSLGSQCFNVLKEIPSRKVFLPKDEMDDGNLNGEKWTAINDL